jgi:hypothetical protein
MAVLLLMEENNLKSGKVRGFGVNARSLPLVVVDQLPRGCDILGIDLNLGRVLVLLSALASAVDPATLPRSSRVRDGAATGRLGASFR